MDSEILYEAISKGASHLLKFQLADGHFEGELSANIFPTCAYGTVKLALGQKPDADLVRWFIKNQNEDQPQPEIRHGVEKDGHHPRPVVEPPATCDR